MKSISYAIYFIAFTLLLDGAICSSFGPFLSSPGNSSILVFLDLHRNYHDTTCTEPDWTIFELAHSLQWKGTQENLTGIEIYDTCSSQTRVYNIVRERLAAQLCNSGKATPISGVLSYSSKAINDILTFNFDSVHIVVEDGATVENDSEQTDGQMHVELASTNNAEILAHVLKSLNWTFVTTISDGHPQSRLEHGIFQRLAEDLNICVQSSETVTNWTSVDILPVKTDGVVIFANDLSYLKSVGEKLPKTLAVAIATHDRRTSKFGFVHSGIVLSDSFGHMEKVSEYMSVLWNQTTLDELSADYYITNHNCSYINQTVLNQILCKGIDEIRAYFNEYTSLRQMHVFFETLTLISSITRDMEKNNCTNYRRSCFNPADVAKLSLFLGVENNQTLVTKPPFNFTLTLLTGGNSQTADSFSTTTFTDISPDVYEWINGGSNSFPTSVCSTWCPSCHSSKCSSVSKQLKFEGDYLFVPGDILITGMIPLSRRWDRMSSGKICTGMLQDSNSYIQSEAFLYAVLSAQSRHDNRMQNISIGALLFDTCSDMKRASQILLNFESCLYNFERKDNHLTPLPTIVSAYVIVGNDDEFMSDTNTFDKLTFGINDKGSLYKNNRILIDSSTFNFEIVVEFLHALNLTYVGLVTSNTSESMELQGLFESARSKNICISYHEVISTQNSELIGNIKKSSANVVVVFANSGDVDSFFRSLTTQKVAKTWILIETRANWLDILAFPLPLGSVIFSPEGIENPKFNEHIDNLLEAKPVDVDTNNPWIEKYKNAITQGNFSSTISKSVTSMRASDIIKTVDISLEAIANALKTVCGNKSSLCPEFLERGPGQAMQEVGLSTNQDETGNSNYQTYVISNLQEGGTIEVGRWTDHHLSLEKEKLKSYDSQGDQLNGFRQSYCFVTPCVCININVTENATDMAKMRQLDYEMGYKNSSAKFQKDLWMLIVVIIAGTGSLLTLVLMVFILCKVCAGAVMRRYLALGILLLIGMVFLFLSVLPFLFTPSENVCGMRFFAHGFSYAFCFGIMLTKMMSLRDYKFIGLGGEISRVNQMLTVFFITSVQVAIGVQWWVLRTPVVYTETILEAGENDALLETTYYACDFVRKDFVSYHSYVILLLLLCCVYSLSVRKETKNMNEAKLLLICSWFCLALWIGIVVTLIILDRKYLEAICAIGILANALSMVVFIYLPKLTAISRLKYDVSEQKAHKENGYKLDPDFQFERPYSLPGTLHSSITDKALTYPRSLATFDTSLSY